MIASVCGVLPLKRILICPKPLGDGGPSLVIRQMAPYLQTNGIQLTFDWSLKVQGALINIAGGKYAPLVLLAHKSYIYRAAGWYIREIFLAESRPWSWKYDISNLLIRSYLKKAKVVVFQSCYASDTLTRLAGKPHSSSIIHNGADLDHFRPFGRARNRIPVIGIVGNHRHERVRDLLRVSQRIPFPHELLVVGNLDAKDYRNLVSYASTRNLTVTAPGYIPSVELPTWYNRADVFLHLATGDICPNVVVQALACGTPVICHHFGGTRELVQDGGIVVEGLSPCIDESFISGAVAAIETVLEELFEYRLRARARAEADLDVRNTATRYSELIMSL